MEDLKELEEAMKSGLPTVSGFFFGVSSDYHHEETLKFIASAKFEIEQGNRVIYSSWW